VSRHGPVSRRRVEEYPVAMPAVLSVRIAFRRANTTAPMAMVTAHSDHRVRQHYRHLELSSKRHRDFLECGRRLLHMHIAWQRNHHE
jgi:hypothetical protein